MNPIIKNILGVIAGIIVGSIVNGAIVTLSPYVIPPPVGVDVNDLESIKANLDAYEFKHFIFPWLAHALGALAGAFVTAKITNHMLLSLMIGAFFMAGGIWMMTMIPQPTLFTIADLACYVPAAYLGYLLGRYKSV